MRKNRLNITLTHVSGFVGSDADNIRVRPTICKIEFIRIVSGEAVGPYC